MSESQHGQHGAAMPASGYAQESFVSFMRRACEAEGRFVANLVTCSRCHHDQCAIWPAAAGIHAHICCVCKTQGTCSEPTAKDAPPNVDLEPDVYHTGRMLFALDQAVRAHGRFYMSLVRCNTCKTEQVAAWPRGGLSSIRCPTCARTGSTIEIPSREMLMQHTADALRDQFRNPTPLDLRI